MPARNAAFSRQDIYTPTDPENIIAGKKNAIFFRRGEEFYFNATGNLNDWWQKLPYRTVCIPPWPMDKLILYKRPYESWIKNSDGLIDYTPGVNYNKVMPKTDWTFYSAKDLFVGGAKRFNWVFPVPTSTNDPIGNNNSRSYDENFFYAKISGKWYRTPIAIYTFPGPPTADNPGRSTSLPFVDPPRVMPVPSNSNASPSSPVGDQSYDAEFFYIKISKWKRSRLGIYDVSNKMTVF
jgi:hypothetical protein